MKVWSDLRFAARAWLAAPAVELSLAWAGLHRTLEWVERSAPLRTGASHRSGSTAAIGPTRGAQLVDRAYRFHRLRGQCLPRALLQYWLHRRDGTAVRFVVGVRRPAAAEGPSPGLPLEAHAWVERAEPTAADSKAAQRQGGDFETLLIRDAVPDEPRPRS